MMQRFAIIVLLSLSLSAWAKGLGYDPAADPFAQLDAAAQTAKKENKLILVVAGGDWCRWCRVLHDYLGKNRDVAKKLKETFVVMKVYLGEENTNEEFFSYLPEAYGVPHFWIISPEKKILGSQDTGVLEQGDTGYNKAKFLSFIERWKKEAAKQKNREKST